MASRKAQSKAGIAESRRGQQMGDDRSKPSKLDEEQKARTPALRGRRKTENKFFADDSSQAAGTSGETLRDNSPSVPAAVPTGTKLGESGGERAFKQRQSRATKKRGG
jgi:hypothetical protein